MNADEYPIVGDIVSVKITRVAEMGLYANLSEFNDKEAFLAFAEMSVRKNRPNKVINYDKLVGKNILVRVLRVDKEGGFVDLSTHTQD